MFKFLKEKLKKWTEKVTKESQKEEVEKPKKEKIKEKVKEVLKEISQVEKPLKKEFSKENVKETQEEIKEEILKKEEIKPGTKSFFQKVTEKISKVKISKEEFDIYGEELEMLLLENNVALEVTEEIINNLREKIVGRELLKKEVEEEIKDSLKETIKKILIEPFDIVEKIKEKKDPYVILFCGINGTGKTTTVAKIADFLKRKGVSSVIAAADTFRAASIEQIKIHGEKIGIKVISHEYGSDPAAVAFDSVNYAKKNKIQCVLIDTAGRMHTAKNLLKEIEKIAKVCNPDLKIFIGESLTGNDAIEQIRSFNWAIGIDGIILTKADVDEKGGTALSVGFVTRKPILYLGTGQEYDQIEPFDKNKFIERLGL